MLVNLLSHPATRRQFDVSLSYRASPRYTAGLEHRVRLDFPVYPLQFPEPSTTIPTAPWWPDPLRRLVRFISRQLATVPLLLYEVWLLHRLFARLNPDVLHINNGGYPAALSARAAAIAGRLAGVPHVVMVVNNLAEVREGPTSVLRAAVDRLVVAAVSRFITGSAAAAAQLRYVLGLGETDCEAYPNGIALRAPTETREETLRRLNLNESAGVLFGVVAVMEPRKGHRVLLEAAVKLVRGADGRAPAFTVLLEGNGPLRAELESFVEAHGLSPYCMFVGDEVNVMNLMSALDVLVLPSIAHEDFPNVILEAMGLGKAVIASRLAGTPEQLSDGATGLLVPSGDADALSAAMSRLCSDAALRQAMGRAGRIRFEERFTADASVRRYVALYQSLIALEPAR